MGLKPWLFFLRITYRPTVSETWNLPRSWVEKQKICSCHTWCFFWMLFDDSCMICLIPCLIEIPFFVRNTEYYSFRVRCADWNLGFQEDIVLSKDNGSIIVYGDLGLRTPPKSSKKTFRKVKAKKSFEPRKTTPLIFHYTGTIYYNPHITGLYSSIIPPYNCSFGEPKVCPWHDLTHPTFKIPPPERPTTYFPSSHTGCLMVYYNFKIRSGKLT